ncbi:MAG: alpha/beta fold hydrolase [Labilithrix sp.]|nr:alpha/beta fold hydrolase [Labilithrix sp.]MBX3220278.1 alpha/beta fold hydrolase [Labilithrix sp.]
MPYVRTRLGRLFYEERGERRGAGDPAIVLLHGLLFDGGMWRGQVEPLAALGRVVVLDGPGHGKSEPAPRFMLEEHADALYDAFGEIGIRRAIVVGLSWGGMVAMRLALQHPAKVAGLALLDTSAEVDALAKRVKYRAFIAMHRRVGFPYALFDKELAPLMFGARTRAENPELLAATYRRTMGFERGGLSRAAIAVVVHRKNVLPELPRVRVPTLVVCGREDQSTPPERSEAIARAIPGAKLALIDGVGHMSALEDPDAVNAHLVPFVRRCIDDPR